MQKRTGSSVVFFFLKELDVVHEGLRRLCEFMTGIFLQVGVPLRFCHVTESMKPKDSTCGCFGPRVQRSRPQKKAATPKKSLGRG